MRMYTEARSELKARGAALARYIRARSVRTSDNRDKNRRLIPQIRIASKVAVLNRHTITVISEDCNHASTTTNKSHRNCRKRLIPTEYHCFQSTWNTTPERRSGESRSISITAKTSRGNK